MRIGASFRISGGSESCTLGAISEVDIMTLWNGCDAKRQVRVRSSDDMNTELAFEVAIAVGDRDNSAPQPRHLSQTSLWPAMEPFEDKRYVRDNSWQHFSGYRMMVSGHSSLCGLLCKLKAGGWRVMRH